jgi:hypothetical protein
MKKDIAKELNNIASSIPLVFDWSTEKIVMKGWELNLTPFGDHQQFVPDEDYQVDVPVMIAVEHKQQVKDAYKRGGPSAVRSYYKSVMAKIQQQ